MANFSLKVNGKTEQIDVDPTTPMLWVLRDHLKLVGTKFGCGIATIEGLSENGDHPVQKAWIEEDVYQCGYCQAGQIMNASAFLKKNPNPSDVEIEDAMNGNICRCGTYTRIKKAIKNAASTSNA